jgi:hypothetical protein
MELDELIMHYKRVREEAEISSAKYKKELGKLSEQIESMLDVAGIKSAKTDHGQAIRSVRRSVRVVDWPLFEAFAEDHPSLIKKSIDGSEALVLLEYEDAIPGTEVNSTTVMTVR